MSRGVLRAVHGWGTHGGIFEPLAKTLTADIELVTVDLPGHGQASQQPLDLDSAQAALVDEAAAGEVWLGWSLGALVVLAAASRRAMAPAGLVLVAATPRFLATGDWPQGMDPAVFNGFRKLLTLDVGKTLDRFIGLEVHGSATARQDRRALRQVLRQRPLPSRVSLEAGLDLLETMDLRDQLQRLDCPVLVVAGQNDRIVHPQASSALAASLPRARLEVLAGCGHAPFIGQPRPFGDLLCGFWEDIEHEPAA